LKRIITCLPIIFTINFTMRTLFSFFLLLASANAVNYTSYVNHKSIYTLSGLILNGHDNTVCETNKLPYTCMAVTGYQIIYNLTFIILCCLCCKNFLSCDLQTDPSKALFEGKQKYIIAAILTMILSLDETYGTAVRLFSIHLLMTLLISLMTSSIIKYAPVFIGSVGFILTFFHLIFGVNSKSNVLIGVMLIAVPCGLFEILIVVTAIFFVAKYLISEFDKILLNYA
jgi:hypothetical protein